MPSTRRLFSKHLRAVLTINILLLSYYHLRIYFPVTINIDKVSPIRVAYAGGVYLNHTYTNSFEALNASYAKGFKHFEIDFETTLDGKIVCLHDWDSTITNLTGYKNTGPMSFEHFERVFSASVVTPCTISSLIDWLKDHPSTFIITDVKSKNLEVIKEIYSKHPQYSNRFIPQIYHPNEFDIVKELVPKYIIWTLYRYKGSDREVIFNLSKFNGKVAIALSINRAKTGLGCKPHHMDITTYAHTVNDIYEFIKLKDSYGIDEIYTDNLEPSHSIENTPTTCSEP